MLVTKLLASRIFLLLITFIVTGIIVFLMLDELHLLINHSDSETLLKLKEDEEGIAILLIGYGVLLEGRHILENWIAGEEVEASHLTHQCEYYGFMLLALGLIIEMIYQLTTIINIDSVSYWTEILINYPINIYALIILIKLLFILVTSKPASDSQ